MNRVILTVGIIGSLLWIPSAQGFDMLNPLAAPADGNVFMFIDDLGGTADNTFTAINTGVLIEDLDLFTIRAATGHASDPNVDLPLATQSIQAWSTPTTGVSDIADRVFIDQAFSGGGGWVDAPEGEWVDNEVSFSAAPTNAGHELIILLTNFGNDGGGTVAYWDNFRVERNSTQVFQDSFETGLTAGMQGEVTDAGWNIGNSTLENSGLSTEPIVPPPPPPPPTPKFNFNQITPLAAPADGNSFLFIDDLAGASDNTNVTVNTGIVINDLDLITIRAATGNALDEPLAKQSIQAWSTAETGTADNLQFIGQAFSTDGSFADAPDGEWVNNELTFAAGPASAGQELVVLVSNFTAGDDVEPDGPFNQGVAFWDNFEVEVNGTLMFSESFEEFGSPPGEHKEVDDLTVNNWFSSSSNAGNSGITAATDLPDTLLGDFNGDGLANFGDLSSAVLALQDPNQFDLDFPNVDRLAACDANQDQQCNFGDLGGLAATYTGGPGQGTSVPEPTSLMLMVSCAVAFLGIRRRAAVR